MTTRIVELRRGILKKNDELAAGLRDRFTSAGVLVLNLVSSPGTGKTRFLSGPCANCALAARRRRLWWAILRPTTMRGGWLRAALPCARSILTASATSTPRWSRKHLESWEGVSLAGLNYLFIENVGNLVCPSSYDLGERIRVVLLSVTEGEDKPLKYPGLFNSADAAVITKIDLAVPCGFDRELALKNINEIRPGIRIFETSAKTGAGMDEWLAYLAEQAQPS